MNFSDINVIDPVVVNQQSIADHILHDSTEYDKQSSYKRDTEPEFACMKLL